MGDVTLMAITWYKRVVLVTEKQVIHGSKWLVNVSVEVSIRPGGMVLVLHYEQLTPSQRFQCL